MVQVHLRLTAHSGRSQEMMQALRLFARGSLMERGCVRACAYSECGNSDAFCYEEDWSTTEDLERQIRSERFSQFLGVMEAAAQPPQLEFRFVERTCGLDYVRALRQGGGVA
jgi:quinol monooxygenase YgiN